MSIDTCAKRNLSIALPFLRKKTTYEFYIQLITRESFLSRIQETKPCICLGTTFRDCFLTDPSQKLSCTFVAEEEGALDDALALFLLRLPGPPMLGELMMSTRRREVAAV